MNPATVVGPLDIAAAPGKKYATKREHIVARAIYREIPKGKDMKQLDLRYTQGIVAFKTRLALDIQKTAEGKTVVVNVEQGRKFDKVMVGFITEGSDKARLDVRYFVDHRDGAIYGPKSPLSPNINHFYGTIHDSNLWDWSGERAVPKNLDKAGVKEIGGYGSYKHYVRADSAFATTPKPDGRRTRKVKVEA